MCGTCEDMLHVIECASHQLHCASHHYFVGAPPCISSFEQHLRLFILFYFSFNFHRIDLKSFMLTSAVLLLNVETGTESTLYFPEGPTIQTSPRRPIRHYSHWNTRSSIRSRQKRANEMSSPSISLAGSYQSMADHPMGDRGGERSQVLRKLDRGVEEAAHDSE